MRFKIVACMLLILPAFSFVLAAPIPVREARDMCTDAMEGDDDIIIVSEKRAPARSDLSDSELGALSPATYYARRRHLGRDLGLSSDGSESPLWSKVWSPPGGTEIPGPWIQEGAFKPGATTGNLPTSASNIKTVQWGPTTKIFTYQKDPLPSPPGREGYLAKQAAQTLPKPKSFGSKVKAFFGNLKLSNLKFRPRFQRTP